MPSVRAEPSRGVGVPSIFAASMSDHLMKRAQYALANVMMSTLIARRCSSHSAVMAALAFQRNGQDVFQTIRRREGVRKCHSLVKVMDLRFKSRVS